jgi:hypothetical protein
MMTARGWGGVGWGGWGAKWGPADCGPRRAGRMGWAAQPRAHGARAKPRRLPCWCSTAVGAPGACPRPPAAAAARAAVAGSFVRGLSTPKPTAAVVEPVHDLVAHGRLARGSAACYPDNKGLFAAPRTAAATDRGAAGANAEAAASTIERRGVKAERWWRGACHEAVPMRCGAVRRRRRRRRCLLHRRGALLHVI